MADYFKTDNSKLLRSILSDKLKEKSLSQKIFNKVTESKKIPKEEVNKAIDWYKDSSREYIKQMGALCKGEIIAVSGSILGIEAWILNHYILERIFKENNYLDVNNSLVKEGLQSERFYNLIKKLGDSSEIAYKVKYEDITDSKNPFWFQDLEDALKYIYPGEDDKNSLVFPVDIGYLEKIKEKKIFS